MYLRDKIGWSAFYDQLIRNMTLMDELNNDKARLTLLAQKWKERNNDITLMCISIIKMPYHQIEFFFDLLNKLGDFDEKRDSLQKRLVHYFSKYMIQKFSLFPCTLEDVDTIKEKEKWKSELDEIFFERIKNILNESGHWFWARTNEELVKIRIFYDTVRHELDDLEYLANSLVAIQRETLCFDWPDDATFDEWKNQIESVEVMEEEEETS